MSSHVYLIKENDNLVSHCACSHAFITFPPQLDCPWCGCGWLFSCIECRKAFTFARAVEVKESWEELARRDLAKRWNEVPDDEQVAGWVNAMEDLHANVEPERRYVCLDGLFIPIDAAAASFDGWYARHDLGFVPQVAALSDREVINRVLANRDYWCANALPKSDG